MQRTSGFWSVPAGYSHHLPARVFLLLQGAVAHQVIGVAPGGGPAAFFRLCCGEELPCLIVGIGLVQYQQVVGQVPVPSMVAVFPCPVRLIGGVGLAAIRIHFPGLFRVFCHDVAPVVIGIDIASQDPAAVVTLVRQPRHLVPGIVCLIGADA